ncbi:hypothetical protein ACSYAD_25350 [Acaryochloris marina NIES-2412]|uniref:hypothetical protein n=1 Tax=Acaryochloris marina TaxID=155978 RepID=UPI00405801C7
MLPNSNTAIVVRPQAHGGKFLGDDIGGALITIKDAQTGSLLAEGLTQGGSGQLLPDYGMDASLTAIATPGQAPQWVHAVLGTSQFCAELPLQRPTLLEISAYGPIGGLQSAHRATILEWVAPGQNLASGAGVVIVIPGLLVQVLTPSTHSKITSDSALIDFSANVTMMCGCPIEESSPWPFNDFVVTANIHNVSQNSWQELDMAYSGTTSLFTVKTRITGTGDYLVTIDAQQISISNGGLGQVSFTLTGS